MATSFPNTIAPGKIRLTLEDYEVLPDDGKIYEILEGELFVNPAPNTRHQRISKKLEWYLLEALEHSGMGEVFHAPNDVVLDRETVVQPDIIFIRKEHAHLIGEKNIQGPPDLVIEILAQSTRRKDLHIKAAVYARFRIPSYWIVDPETNAVEQFRLIHGAYESITRHTASETLTSDEFPELQIPLAKVF